MSTATLTRERPLPEGILTMANVGLGADLGDGTISLLSAIHRGQSPEAVEMIEIECHGRPRLNNSGEKLTGRIPCPTKDRFKVMRIFSTSTACDGCREAYLEDTRIASCRSFWEAACPADLRATDPNYPGDAAKGIPPFPTALYQNLRSTWKFDESLFLFGPSGSAKTKTGALLMKRALLAGKDIGFLWPEELKDAAQSRFDRLKLLRGFAARDVLMLDDALMTGAQDEKITDFLRDLIDLLIRNGNHFIITSQVGEADYSEAADKFGKATSADKERIAAIFRRIREKCRVVPFAAGSAVTAATQF